MVTDRQCLTKQTENENDGRWIYVSHNVLCCHRQDNQTALDTLLLWIRRGYVWIMYRFPMPCDVKHWRHLVVGICACEISRSSVPCNPWRHFCCGPACMCEVHFQLLKMWWDNKVQRFYGISDHELCCNTNTHFLRHAFAGYHSRPCVCQGKPVIKRQVDWYSNVRAKVSRHCELGSGYLSYGLKTCISLPYTPNLHRTAHLQPNLFQTAEKYNRLEAPWLPQTTGFIIQALALYKFDESPQNA